MKPLVDVGGYETIWLKIGPFLYEVDAVMKTAIADYLDNVGVHRIEQRATCLAKEETWES